MNSAEYNPANQVGMVSMTFAGSQPRSQEHIYNSLNQLESIKYNGGPPPNGGTGIGYEYVAGQNNGQVSVLHDYIAGQTVSYQYDSLKRLAQATSPGSWSQSYTYDGFGKLTSKTGTNPQSLHVDSNTNRLLIQQGQTLLDGGFCYDKFGNMISDNATCQV